MTGSLHIGDAWLRVDDDALLTEIGVPDPYRDAGWSGGDLTRLGARVRAHLGALRTTVEASVLAAHRKPRLEAWMEPLVARQLAAAPHHDLLARIAELVSSAERAGETLHFDAD